MNYRINLPWEKQRALAQIKGLVLTDKFGYTVDIDTGDPSRQVWDRAHDLSYLDTPQTFYISSSDDADTANIQMIVLTEDKRYIPLFIDLQGNTPLDISTGSSPDPDFCGVGCKFYRGIRMKPSNGYNTTGNVYLSSDNAGIVLGVPPDADVQAWFSAATQQTQMTHFTIPENYWALLTELYIGILNEGNVSPSNADVILHQKKMENTVFTNKWTLPVNTEGGPVIIKGDGRLIKPETDLHFDVQSVGRNDTKVAVSYTIEMYDERYINPPIILD